jgi:hypothetical protein
MQAVQHRLDVANYLAGSLVVPGHSDGQIATGTQTNANDTHTQTNNSNKRTPHRMGTRLVNSAAGVHDGVPAAAPADAPQLVPAGTSACAPDGAPNWCPQLVPSTGPLASTSTSHHTTLLIRFATMVCS